MTREEAKLVEPGTLIVFRNEDKIVDTLRVVAPGEDPDHLWCVKPDAVSDQDRRQYVWIEEFAVLTPVIQQRHNVVEAINRVNAAARKSIEVRDKLRVDYQNKVTDMLNGSAANFPVAIKSFRYDHLVQGGERVLLNLSAEEFNKLAAMLCANVTAPKREEFEQSYMTEPAMVEHLAEVAGLKEQLQIERDALAREEANVDQR